MFDTSELKDQLRVVNAQKKSLEEAIRYKDIGYSHYLQQEALFYVRNLDNVDQVLRITADMREIVFHNGFVAVFCHGAKRVIEFRHGKKVVEYVHGGGIEMDEKIALLPPERFAGFREALSQVVGVSHEILFGVAEHWRRDVRPLMTPKFLSSLYCACAVRWVAGQFPSTPWEDVVLGHVIPRIVGFYGNEIPKK